MSCSIHAALQIHACLDQMHPEQISLLSSLLEGIRLSCSYPGYASSRVLGRAGLGGWLGLKCYSPWGAGVGGAIVYQLSYGDTHIYIVFLKLAHSALFVYIYDSLYSSRL